MLQKIYKFHKKINKKIVFVILLLLLTVITIRYFTNKKNIINKDTELVTFTGAMDEEISMEEKKSSEQYLDLTKIVPIQNNQFTLEYNYKKITFTVTLFPPYTENKQKFLVWLVENGYEAIPQTEFEYIINK